MSTKASKKHSYDRIALALQGGGSLGAYHIGVCQAMHEHGYEPDVVAGISIGGITAAIIAGNDPEQRESALKNFWKDISYPDFGEFLNLTEDTRRLHNMFSSMQGFLYGQPNFFEPMIAKASLSGGPSTPQQSLSYYDVNPLMATLQKHVDFDRINRGETRLLLGSVKVSSGELVFFDSAKQTITPHHVMASGALPPAFPAIEIDGELYWDGGCVSNTPLEGLFNITPEAHTLAFVVDLFSVEGEVPTTLDEVSARMKEITYGSRTHHHINHIAHKHNLRQSVHHLLSLLPTNARKELQEDMQSLASSSDFDIVHCVYRPHPAEISTRDCEFSRMSIVDRAEHGYRDMGEALVQAPWLNKTKDQVRVGCRVHRFVSQHPHATDAAKKAKA